MSMALCVKGAGIFCGEPFVPAEPIVIVWVNDGKFALSKSYSAESVAVANAAIQKHRKDDDALKPVRDSDG